MKQIYVLLTFVLIFSAVTLQAQIITEYLQQGDNAASSFDNKKALEIFQKADKAYPNNWEIQWRISRTYVDMAEFMPANSDEQKDDQLAVYEKALSFADKSVKGASGQSITYLRRAIANGKIALFKGVFSVSAVVNQVKDDCEMAIKLGTGGSYVQALAHYVLGRTHLKISEKWAPARAVIGLGWADAETGLKELKKAVDMYPGFRMFYLDLAKAYIENDEYDKARNTLKKLIETPVKHQNDEAVFAEAKTLLNDIKDE